MKIGFIFAGQGQQFLYMGQDLAEAYPAVASIYQRAYEILGYDVLSLDEAALSQTQYTQPALYVLGHALDTILKLRGVIPDCTAGLSLGELNALTSSGSLSFDQGLALISKRAAIMQHAYEPHVTGMIACLKTDRETIEKLIAHTNIEICNVNSQSQIVIGGYTAELQETIPVLKKNRIMAVPLKVSTVSHMSLLKDASLQLRHELESVTFDVPQIAFINNIDAVFQNDGFVDTLSRHISEPTEFYQLIQKMYENGIRQYIEIGPKGSLSKLIKEICGVENVITQNIYNVETLGELKL